jgi:FAD/FMN-containing dehydrogenase
MSTAVDAEGLAAELRINIQGEVRFDEGSRSLYATDGSNYRQVPMGVVIPCTVEDVIETIAVARRYGAPVLARGGGTSLAGQCCNVAVIIDCSKYLNRIVELRPEDKLARVQPGLILDHLRHAAEQYHLTFGPDPSTHDHCTLGGMIGNNSCGVHSVMAGRTAENVEELEILTYDGLRLRVGQTSDAELERIIHAGGRRGEIYARLKALRDRYADEIRKRYPKIPRRVSGYNLDQLLPENGFHVARALVGSESTCVTVLEATVRLVHSPPARSLVVLCYPDVYQAGDHVPEVLEYGPIGLEGIDDRLVAYIREGPTRRGPRGAAIWRRLAAGRIRRRNAEGGR